MIIQLNFTYPLKISPLINLDDLVISLNGSESMLKALDSGKQLDSDQHIINFPIKK